MLQSDLSLSSLIVAPRNSQLKRKTSSLSSSDEVAMSYNDMSHLEQLHRSYSHNRVRDEVVMIYNDMPPLEPVHRSYAHSPVHVPQSPSLSISSSSSLVAPSIPATIHAKNENSKGNDDDHIPDLIPVVLSSASSSSSSSSSSSDQSGGSLSTLSTLSANPQSLASTATAQIVLTKKPVSSSFQPWLFPMTPSTSETGLLTAPISSIPEEVVQNTSIKKPRFGPKSIWDEDEAVRQPFQIGHWQGKWFRCRTPLTIDGKPISIAIRRGRNPEEGTGYWIVWTTFAKLHGPFARSYKARSDRFCRKWKNMWYSTSDIKEISDVGIVWFCEHGQCTVPLANWLRNRFLDFPWSKNSVTTSVVSQPTLPLLCEPFYLSTLSSSSSSSLSLLLSSSFSSSSSSSLSSYSSSTSSSSLSSLSTPSSSSSLSSLHASSSVSSHLTMSPLAYMSSIMPLPTLSQSQQSTSSSLHKPMFAPLHTQEQGDFEKQAVLAHTMAINDRIYLSDDHKEAIGWIFIYIKRSIDRKWIQPMNIFHQVALICSAWYLAPISKSRQQHRVPATVAAAAMYHAFRALAHSPTQLECSHLAELGESALQTCAKDMVDASLPGIIVKKSSSFPLST